MRERRSHYDVTNSVHIADPLEVQEVVCSMMAELYPRADLAPLRLAFDTFTRLYAGILPGYHGCDTWYHDAQHSLDCTLTLARLINGHERSQPKKWQLGARRAKLGLVSALFHDSGYIRRHDETEFKNGAEFTFYHVSRSSSFLVEYLPQIGFAKEAKLAGQLVHFTGYEIELDKIRVSNPRDRRLGFMLGTADLIAQMADRCYLEKCRRYLYHEFQSCGLAAPGIPGGPTPVYNSPDDLMRKTPEFIDKLFEERLDGYFEGVYKLMSVHFNGINPYMLAVEKHLEHLRRAVDEHTLKDLRRRPRSINARALREMLKVRLSEVRPRAQKAKLPRRRQVRRSKQKKQLAGYMPT